MAKVLIVDQDKCTACRRCELACSFKHTDTFNPAAARLSVAAFLDDDYYLPVVCQHCDEPVCQAVCPAGAISRDEKTNAVIINEDRCIGCRMCIMACPFGGVDYSVAEHRVVKCDLCGGEPECVLNCPWGALEYKEPAGQALSKRQQMARKVQAALREVV
ncbi:MAG: 4Fe-4S dicluster domain-containing protein [Moorella humiferrea]|uniref:Anaerobic dimethyl sulfoxide reductase chain B n=1 Tax=Neomoorella humiferrea TaxID=676965 RepID=A0A2T0AYW4_9FIRM|nr:4Fe-4S dicluster domain-containing protein [Moorella humiferrea]MBE3573193.1 4Fe-4S dicluster domain-containing protein [Moorella humiferrea]PRR76194.1 Anaerobic dimethyl sulfoxide reductase chain B [Moorella humiferrea]